MLLATDGSPESKRAARAAIELSDRLGLELHVVYVTPIPSVYALSEATILDPEVQERPREIALRDAREIWMVFSELVPDALEETRSDLVAAVVTLALAAMTAFQFLVR